MKPFLLLLCANFTLFAQTAATGIVAGQLTIEGPALMKTLYGGRVPVLVGNIVVKNYSQSAIQVGSADIYLALSTIDTVPASDASAALTKVYGYSKTQRLIQLGQAVAGGVGILAATSSPISVGVKTLGYLLFGSAELSQAVNVFTADQPNLSSLLSNSCDSLPSGMALVSGGSLQCKVYIQKPARGAALPSAIAFQLVPTGPSAPGLLPPAAPLGMPRKLLTGENSTERLTDALEARSLYESTWTTAR